MIAWLKKLFNNPYEPTFKRWVETKESVIIAFPIMSYDHSIPDIMIKASKEEVYGDPDFWLWKWNDKNRIIDSTGKVFKPIYEIRGNWDPVTYPGPVERIMELEDFKKMVIEVLKSQKREPSLSRLIEQVESENSIQNIMDRINYEF